MSMPTTVGYGTRTSIFTEYSVTSLIPSRQAAGSASLIYADEIFLHP